MKVLFLSDFHLGARYIKDSRAHEAAICRFLREKGKDADHIYLLGDILDYWFEYKEVVPRGFVRFLGTLADLSDAGVKITWLTGNHDIWLFDYLRSELAIEVIDACYERLSIGDKNFILAHGDRLGSEKRSFKIISRVFRNKICQKLYSSIHPRWTVPFARRWSSNSRYSHSEEENRKEYHLDKIRTDVNNLLRTFPDTNYVILGHHHHIIDFTADINNCRVIVLGDWLDKFSYAEFDGLKMHLLTYQIDGESFVN